jgi:hypothetical protein
MHMARIPLVVDEEEKRYWIRLAHQEEVTLNEWLRRAARARAREEWPTTGGAPLPVPLSEWPELALEEVAAAKAPADDGDLTPTSEPSASSASCRRVKIHHIYHAGQPCPLCNFPLGG